MGKPFEQMNRLPESPYDRTPTRSTVGWMQQLPQRVVPRRLASRYARIANRLARLWDTPAACRAYLDSLLLDGRGGRRGFAPEVVNELHVLSDHYCKLHPLVTRDVWDDVRECARVASPRRGRS
jgi:hypothetical protein